MPNPVPREGLGLFYLIYNFSYDIKYKLLIQSKFMKFEDIDNTKNDTDKLLSPEEITNIKKDLHMTGRALRVGESLSDYQQERLSSWLKINEAQNRQDQLDIEAAREVINANDNPTPENTDNFENYQKLANVKIATQKLRNLLDQNQNQVNLADRAKEIIYDMLTQRSEFIENTILAGKDALDLKKLKNYNYAYFI